MKKRYGIQLGHTLEWQMTNLRFADDVLLTSNTLHQITTMLADVQVHAGAAGLQLHPDKTKIFTNATKKTGRGRNTHAEVNGMHIEILSSDGKVKYLGRMLGGSADPDAEVRHRLRQSWKAFMAHKSELTCKRYSLASRLRLFESVVTPTAMYGASSWTLTAELCRQLKSTQRKMLRMILGSGRQRLKRRTSSASGLTDSSATSPDTDAKIGDENVESWIQWVVRTTQTIETHAVRNKIDDWCLTWRRRTWRFARRVAYDSSGKWTLRAAMWDANRDKRAKGRPPNRPHKRWSDDICQYLQSLGGRCYARELVPRTT